MENSPIVQERGQTCDVSLEVIHLEMKDLDKMLLHRDQIWSEKSWIPFLGTEFELQQNPQRKMDYKGRG